MKTIHVNSVAMQTVDGAIQLLLKTEQVHLPDELLSSYTFDDDTLIIQLASKTNPLCQFRLPGLDRSLLDCLFSQDYTLIELIGGSQQHYRFITVNQKCLFQLKEVE